MTLLSDIGRFLLMLKGMFKKLENRQMYWKELMRQCTEIGFGSLGIVTIISVFIGLSPPYKQLINLSARWFRFQRLHKL